MLIKFYSKESGEFVMLGGAANELLTMMGYGGATEGSVSGDALVSALRSLETSVAHHQDGSASISPNEEPGASNSDEDEDDDKKVAVSLSARALPLFEMLRRARDADGYVMWRQD